MNTKTIFITLIIVVVGVIIAGVAVSKYNESIAAKQAALPTAK